ncbi:12-oxophytodienoate reductase 1 [Irineochytrium annulatum]|nr:12-oxophytodienoate reductase 1 [Irineochytrium annulatum]
MSLTTTSTAITKSGKPLPAFLAGQHPDAPHTFSPIVVGDLLLNHRVVMGPMTRSKSPGEVANHINAHYYAQRATRGGLLISEGVAVHPTAYAFKSIPGLFTDAHTREWAKVTQAVHDNGGLIFAQVWHPGRLCKQHTQPGNALPVAPSAKVITVHPKAKANAPARELPVSEIKDIVNHYRICARNSRLAGFDGIEIHAAHGYLIEQFLCENSNFRTDQYGGSLENRTRFLIEILDACLLELPPGRVAVRFSPGFNSYGVAQPNPVELYTYVLKRVAPYGLAYVHLTQPVWGEYRQGPPHEESTLRTFMPLVKAPTRLLVTGGYTRDIGEKELAGGRGDLIGVGRAFITNPDLVKRWWYGREISGQDFKEYYGGNASGYIDFPTWEEEQGRKEWKVDAKM